MAKSAGRRYRILPFAGASASFVFLAVAVVFSLKAAWRPSTANAAERRPQSITIGSTDHIFYFGGATAEDAATLRDGLDRVGFWKDNGSAVFYSKAENGFMVAFVDRDGAWNNPDSLANFDTVVGIAAKSTGVSLRYRLLSSQGKIEVQRGPF